MHLHLTPNPPVTVTALCPTVSPPSSPRAPPGPSQCPPPSPRSPPSSPQVPPKPFPIPPSVPPVTPWSLLSSPRSSPVPPPVSPVPPWALPSPSQCPPPPTQCQRQGAAPSGLLRARSTGASRGCHRCCRGWGGEVSSCVCGSSAPGEIPTCMRGGEGGSARCTLPRGAAPHPLTLAPAALATPRARDAASPAREGLRVLHPGGALPAPPPYLPWQLLHWQLRMTGSTTGSVWPPGQGRRRMRMGLAGSRR